MATRSRILSWNLTGFLSVALVGTGFHSLPLSESLALVSTILLQADLSEMILPFTRHLKTWDPLGPPSRGSPKGVPRARNADFPHLCGVDCEAPLTLWLDSP